MKKKKLFFFILVPCILLLSGCNQNKDVKTMICSATATQGNVDMTLHYEVTYHGEYVKTVNTKEVMTSTDTKTLEAYKTQLEDIYKDFDGIDHYKYHFEIEGNTLTSTVSIDYEKVDTDKILAVDDSTDQLIKNGKVKLEDIKKVYEDVGATCKMQ